MSSNSYIFDQIETDNLGQHWGYKNIEDVDEFTMLELLPPGESEESLIKRGFARCSATGKEGFCV